VRQHWAKVHSAPESVAGRFPGLAAFRAVRQRFDPGGVLLNGFTTRALGAAEPLRKRKARPTAVA
jgi:hypothetical protein